MTSKSFSPRAFVLFVFMFGVAAVRVIINLDCGASSLANFSPVGAMAIFGGAYFDKRIKAFAFPLLMLFVSDFILQLTVFKNTGNGILYGGWYWVYGSISLMVIVGRILLKTISLSRCLLASFICALIHWIGTDGGVWLNSKRYTQDVSGFINCLVDAIPFEWRFLTGTLIYSSILFGLFEWVHRKYPAPQLTRS
jgi:hypothetical protein